MLDSAGPQGCHSTVASCQQVPEHACMASITPAGCIAPWSSSHWGSHHWVTPLCAPSHLHPGATLAHRLVLSARYVSGVAEGPQQAGCPPADMREGGAGPARPFAQHSLMQECQTRQHRPSAAVYSLTPGPRLVCLAARRCPGHQTAGPWQWGMLTMAWLCGPPAVAASCAACARCPTQWGGTASG
jgi:hypothetical protein